METSIIISGFGGQGGLFGGQLLAYAGMDNGRFVTWIPSYGPEMRGGTANCTVIISHDPVGAPIVARPDIALVFNQPSYAKYAVARRCLNTKKIGHCGTLDPMATGMLILVVGTATRIQDLLMSEDKEYTGTMALGATTNTQDAEGEIVEQKPVPDFSKEDITAAFDQFRGDFYQTPPMVSAVKIDGVPLYKLARQGKEVVREPRFVRVYNYELTRVEMPQVDFRVVCSKGFYVRTYAHDIGQKLGCGAHLSARRRTRSGHFTLEPGKHVHN